MIKNPHKGKFVTFEGIDFSGKSEQYVRTRNYLTANYPDFKASYLKEPRDPEIYDLLFNRHPDHKINEMHPFTIQAWYFRDRVLNFKKNVIPALEAGVSVIMDRGPLSVVFGASHIGDIRHLMEIQKQFFIGAEVPFIWPDANLIFDIPMDEFSKRAEKSGRPRDEFEKVDKQIIVRNNYHQFAKLDLNCHLIDGHRDPKDVFDDTWLVLQKTLKLEKI